MTSARIPSRILRHVDRVDKAAMIRVTCAGLAVLILIAAAAVPEDAPKCVSPTSEWGVEFYCQGGVVVNGIAYFTSDDGNFVKTGPRPPSFPCAVAFDVRTLRKVRTYPISQTYDSSPFLFQKKDGTCLVIAHEHKNKRTVACRRDTAQVQWISEANQPGSYFFGYSSFRRPDSTQLILVACQNGLHAMSGETGKDVWWVKERSTGGITPCVDQKQGWVFYQCDGKVLKVRATDGEILKETTVRAPNVCISWNTVLVNDSQGCFVATRWYGKPEWDSAIRVFDKDLNLVWERTGLPVGKKDTLTYAEGRLVTGSGNHWSKKYEGDKWKYVAAYSVRDGSILWRCDLSHIPYESLFNLPYFNGFFYAETTGGDYGSSKLLRIRASDGTLMEVLDYGRSISSCAPCILAHGKLLSGDLGEDRVVVTEIAENSKADWPGPFGDPQTNQFALPHEPGVRLVTMKEIRPQQQRASAFEATTKNKEDQVKIQAEGGKVIFSISSPSGIGSAAIRRGTGKWPAAVALRLRLRGLESLRITNGKATVGASVTSVADPTVRCHRIEDGKEKPVGRHSPLWIDVKMLDTRGAAKNEIPPEGGSFEVTVPKALFQGQPSLLTVNWIDFDRG